MGAFIKTGLNYSYFKLPVSLENIVIKMCFVDHTTLNVCIIYRPPNLKLEIFLTLFEDLLLELKALSGEILLLGDLNIDIIGNQRNFFDYKNFLLSFDLEVQNIEPTRVTKSSSTCIDHIIAAEETQVTTINCTISDHYGLMCGLKFISEKKNVDSYHSDFNYDLLLNDDYCLKFLFLLKNRLNKIYDDDPDLYIIEVPHILIDEISKYCLRKIRKKE